MATQAQTKGQSGPPVGVDARERLLAAMPVTERQLQLAGISTAVLEGGDGPPVVLLHGPAGYAAHWMDRTCPAFDLATGFAVTMGRPQESSGLGGE
jgi:pimeloyl-ACP methyl ester carboxylesterase